MQFIAPDKPIRTSEEFLNDVEVDEWSCEMKLDGYRIEIGKDNGKIISRSRHDEILKINNKLIDLFREILEDGSAIDGEWINHSRIKSINTTMNVNLPLIECIGFHDITWFNGKFTGSMPLDSRRNLPIFKKLEAATMNNPIGDLQVFKIPMLSVGNVLDFYNEQKNFTLSEGIVIKKRNSKLIGGKLQSAKNPCWYKIKYRD